MEINPHPLDNSKVVLTIEDRHEDELATDSLPVLPAGIEIDGQFLDIHDRQDSYPFDVLIARRLLGDLASKAMVSREGGDLEIARQVLEYFESERKTPSQIDEEQARAKMKVINVGDITVTILKDAAEYLSVHPNTLRRWADDGIIQVLKLPSGIRRFPIDSLVALREQMYEEVNESETARKTPGV